MPTPPYAKMTAVVNGGAPQEGMVLLPSAANVQLGAESTVDIETYDFRFFAGTYPDGWSTPAGWTLDPDGDIYWQGATPTPPAITYPASAPDAWLPVLTVNGFPSTAGNPALIDTSMILVLLGVSGIGNPAYTEAYQRNAAKAYVGVEQSNWTIVDAAIGTSQASSGVFLVPAKTIVIGHGTNVQNTAGISDLTITSASYSTSAIVVLAADQTVGVRITATAKNTHATGGNLDDSYTVSRTAIWKKVGGAAPVSAGDGGIVLNMGDAGENTISVQFAASGSTQVLLQAAGVAGHTLAMAVENCAQLRG